MDEIQSIADIQSLVRRGFSDWRKLGEVNVAREGGFLIFNYTNKTQYEARWNYFERVSRGLMIEAATGEVAARAFDKFFNWDEGGRRAAGHIVSVTEKVDGSLGVLYRADDGYRIATRGALESSQAIWATRRLNDRHKLEGLPEELTLLFEIVYPENRIIVDYAGREDLVLLGARDRRTGAYLPLYPSLYELAERHGFPLPKVHAFNSVNDIIASTDYIDVNQEGYVAEFSCGERFKFKGDRYREMARAVAGLTFRRTLESVASGTIEQVREFIPDEFLGEFNGWVAQIESKVAEIKGRVAAAMESAPRDSRKDFALWAKASQKDLMPYLFLALDGKDYTPAIYKTAFEGGPEGDAKRSA